MTVSSPNTEPGTGEIFGKCLLNVVTVPLPLPPAPSHSQLKGFWSPFSLGSRQLLCSVCSELSTTLAHVVVQHSVPEICGTQR